MLDFDFKVLSTFLGALYAFRLNARIYERRSKHLKHRNQVPNDWEVLTTPLFIRH